MAYSKKSQVGDLSMPQPRGDNKGSVQIFDDMPSSVGVAEEMPSSIGLTEEQASSVGVFQQEASSVGVTQTEPSSVGVFQSEPSSVGVIQAEASSVGVFQAEASSAGVFQSEPSSVGVLQTEASSVGAFTEESSSVGVFQTEPSSVGVISGEPSSVGVFQSEASSVGVLQAEPSSVTVVQQEPSSVGIFQAELGSASVLQEQAASAAVHEQELRGVLSLSRDDQARTTIQCQIAKDYGKNAIVGHGEFHIAEATGMDGWTVNGAAIPGRGITTGTDGVTVVAGTATALASTEGYDITKSGLHVMGISLITLHQSIAGTLLPRRVKLQALTVASGMTLPSGGDKARIYIPNSTIIAPVTVTHNPDDYSAIIMSLGPVYIPFLLETSNYSGSTSGNMLLADGTNIVLVPASASADTADKDTFGAIMLNKAPAGTRSGGNATVVAPYAIRSNAAIADPALSRYTSQLAAAPVASAFYRKGWESTITASGSTPVNVLSNATIELIITPIGSFAKTAESAKHCGAGIVRVEIASVSGGGLAAAGSDFSAVADKYIHYANPDWAPAAQLGSGMNTEVNAVRTQPCFDTDFDYAKYVFPISGCDISLCVCTADDFADLANKTWLAIYDGTNYTHPENLPYILGDLPASSGNLAPTQVRVLSAANDEYSLIVTYGGADYLLYARKAYTFSGGGYLVDEGERNAWIVSQYLIDGGHAMDYLARWGFGGGVPARSIGHEVMPASLDNISENVVDNQANKACRLYAGNRFMLDSSESMQFSRQLDYGRTELFFLPWAADQSMLAITDGANYGVPGLCIPTLLPTVTAGHPGSIHDSEQVQWSVGSSVFFMDAAGDGSVNDLLTAANVFWLSCMINNFGNSVIADANQTQGFASWAYAANTSTLVSTTLAKHTRIAVQMPSLASGGVYASLPATLSALVGYDCETSGIALGSRHFGLGERSYTAAGERLYASSTYPLMANLSRPVLGLSGTFDLAGHYLTVAGSSGTAIYAYDENAGLQHVASSPSPAISNYAVAYGRVCWIAADGIWTLGQSGPELLYRFSSTFVPTTAAIAMAGSVCYCLAKYGSTIQAFIIGPDAVYQTSGISGSYSLLPVTIGGLALVYASSATPAMLPLTTGAATARTLETNTLPVAREHMRFVLTGVRVVCNMTGSADPFDVDLYADGAATATWAKTDIGSKAAGVHTLSYETGVIPCMTVKAKLYNISANCEIYDMQLLGYYSSALCY